MFRATSQAVLVGVTGGSGVIAAAIVPSRGFATLKDSQFKFSLFLSIFAFPETYINNISSVYRFYVFQFHCD